MLIHQELKLDKDKVILRNVTEDDPAAKSAMDMRRHYNGEGNAKGFSAEKSLQHLCRLDLNTWMYDPMLKEYRALKAAGNAEAASRVLRLFLSVNSQFKASEARM